MGIARRIEVNSMRFSLYVPSELLHSFPAMPRKEDLELPSNLTDVWTPSALESVIGRKRIGEMTADEYLAIVEAWLKLRAAERRDTNDRQ